SLDAFFAPGSGAESPFVSGTANNFQPTPAGNAVHYGSDPATAVLLDNAAQPVVVSVGADVLGQFPMYANGIRSGKLFVNLADAAVGRATAGGNTYLIKWLDREIRFAHKSVLVCDSAGLTVAASMPLPTAQDLKNPSDPNSAIYVGARPTVTDAPRVIHGEVKF